MTEVKPTGQGSSERPESGPEAAAEVTPRRARRSLGIGRFIRTQPFGAVALGLILIFVLAAVLAPWIAPYDPVMQQRGDFQLAPNSTYLLGTDDLGRDVLSRVIYGARTSLLIAVVTVVFGGMLGVVIGTFSGYFGGRWIDTVIQRILEPLMAIPGVVLLLFVAALLGPSVQNTIIALSFLVVPGINRVARAEMLKIREEPYVEAAKANGSGLFRILRRHGLPNMIAPILVIMSLLFAGVILAESALSFLGIGTPPPTPSWGRMLSDGSRYMELPPWMVIFPGGALTIAVLAFNLLGDALRDFFDPKRTTR